MPIIKSAKKKLKQDKKRTARNTGYERAFKKTLTKIGQKKGSAVNLISTLYSQIDKAAKKRVIHKNKAKRLKARLAKRLTVKKPVRSKSKK